MEALKKGYVHMKNPHHVEEVLNHLAKDGASKLQVISDFDHTLSRKHRNGVSCLSSFGLLETNPFVTDEHKSKAKELFDYYYPIEHDPQISQKDRELFVTEWYKKSIKLIIDSKFSKKHIEGTVQSTDCILRDDCDVFFASLNSQCVPLLILSAGNGDVIKEIIQQKQISYPNVKIISNFLDFDEQGAANGLKGELIHSFNKSTSTVEKRDYFGHQESRHNVLLLGDMVADTQMSAGLTNIKKILRIGFLNTKVEENLPGFLEAFDIVIVEDQTMELPNALLKHIL